MPGTDVTKKTTGELERWWQEHSELDQLVENLTEATGAASATAASAALEELAEALEGHFAVEEEVYFPLVDSFRPELAEAVKGARWAHVVLRKQLEQIRTHLSNGEMEPARGLVALLLNMFREHEAHEGRLIADLSTSI